MHSEKLGKDASPSKSGANFRRHCLLVAVINEMNRFIVVMIAPVTETVLAGFRGDFVGFASIFLGSCTEFAGMTRLLKKITRFFGFLQRIRWNDPFIKNLFDLI